MDLNTKYQYPTKTELKHNLEELKSYCKNLTEIIEVYEIKQNNKRWKMQQEERSKQRKEDYEREQKRLKKMTTKEISKEKMVNKMKDLFNEYVKDNYGKDILFHEEYVIDNSDLDSFYGDLATRRGEYQHNGITITYLSRHITHKGDTDMFSDYKVVVNGYTVVDVEKE